MDIQEQSRTADRLLSGWIIAEAAPPEDYSAPPPEGKLERPPSALLSYFLIALPLSLLLPVMVNFAGGAYGSRIARGFSAPSWERLLSILALELLMIPLLAGIARLGGRFFQVPVNNDQAYLMVILGAIPLWLAALALAVPSLVFILMSGTVAVGLSAYALYRSMRSLLDIQDETLATLFCGLLMVCAMPLWTAILALVLIR